MWIATALSKSVSKLVRGTSQKVYALALLIRRMILTAQYVVLKTKIRRRKMDRLTFKCVACGKGTINPNAGCTCDDCYGMRKTDIAVKCTNCDSLYFTPKTSDNIKTIKKAGHKLHANPYKLEVILVVGCENCEGKQCGKS